MYLANWNGGMFIVYVFQPMLVSHTIAVDASWKFTIDSTEEFPLCLEEVLLSKTGGDEANAVNIGEVRQLVLQKKR